MWLNHGIGIQDIPLWFGSFRFKAGNDRCGGVGPLGCKLPRREAVDKGSWGDQPL